jgi:ParB family transcriptional regulator, chromosome partitioning protein
MPVQFNTETEVTKTDVFRLPADELLFSDFTGRHFEPSEDSLESLIQSILKDGQLEPVCVRKDKDDKPIIVFGHRRVRAIRLINERGLADPPLPVQAVYKRVNAEEAALLTLLENEERQAVSPIDLAYMIRQLQDRYGYSDKDLAEKLHKKQSEISKYKKLLDLDSKSQKAIVAGDLNLHSALTLLGVAEESRETVVQLAKEETAKQKENNKTKSRNGQVPKATARAIADVARKTGAATKSHTRTMGELKALLSERIHDYNNNEKTTVGRGQWMLCTALMEWIAGKDSDLEDLLDSLE